MKIAMLTPSIGNTGGIDTYISEITKRSDNVDILTYELKGDVEEISNQVVLFKNKSDLKKAIKNYDIIHVHYFPTNFYASFLNKPVVHTWHGIVPPRYFIQNPKRIIKTFLVYFSHSVAFLKASKIISVSKFLEDQLGPLKSKSVFIPNGVDLKKFQYKRKKTKDRLNFLYVGALEYYRGVHMIPVWAKQFPEADFKIIGRGKLQDNLNQASKQLKNLDVIGYVQHTDLPEIYQESHVHLRPSLYEGFGIPVIESMSTGTPVIATDIAPFRELVTPGKDGILSNLESFKDHIKHFIDSPKEIDVLGRNARKTATKFSWDWIAKSVQETYIQAYNE